MSGFEDQIRQAAERRQHEESRRFAEQRRFASSMATQEQRFDLLRSAAAILASELTAHNVEHDRTFERLRERTGLFRRSRWVAEWTASGWTLVWKQAQALNSPASRNEVMVCETGELVYFWGPVHVTALSPNPGKNLHAVADSHVSRVGPLTLADVAESDGLPRPSISLGDVERALADKAVEYRLDPELFWR